MRKFSERNDMQLDLYWDHVPRTKLHLLKQLWMAVCLAGGAGGNLEEDKEEGAFIGRVLWADIIMRMFETGLKFWAPSDKQKRAARQALTIFAQHNGIVVGDDFGQLVKQCVMMYGPEQTLACIAVPTGLHEKVVQQAFDNGALNVYLDKPAADRMPAVKAIVNCLDEDPRREAYLLQNHRNNPPVHLLRFLYARAKAAGKRRKLKTGFDQPWYQNDQDSKQAKARLIDAWAALLDLGWHVLDLLQFIAQAEATHMVNAQALNALDGDNSDVITGGSAECELANEVGVEASWCFDQACSHPDTKADDIWAMLELPDDSAIYLWRMYKCGGDKIVRAKPGVTNPDIHDPDQWMEPDEYGTSELFAPVQGLFEWRPGGHTPFDWHEMGFWGARGVLGDIARRNDLPLVKAGLLSKAMQIPQPTIRKEGVQLMAGMHAFAECASSGQRTDLAQFMN